MCTDENAKVLLSMMETTRYYNSTPILTIIKDACLESTEVLCLTIFMCIIFAIVAFTIVDCVRGVCFSKIDICRDDIGFFSQDERVSKKKAKDMTLRQRLVGSLPPVYPNGWFHLMDSRELESSQVKNVFALGEQLAVFRDKRRKVNVLNAYCPHMGANMAAGGRVVGSGCLECPFHGWVFSGETGECVNIPYSSKTPTKARVRKWPSCEINGKIYFWYHCDREEPNWRIPDIKELRTFKYVGRTEHVVNAHIQEIPENAADFAHLGHLHKPVFSNKLENSHSRLLEHVRHKIAACWTPPNDGRHHRSTLHIEDNLHLSILGFNIYIKKFIFDIEQLGPGNVHIYMNTANFKGVLIQTITPTEPLVQRLRHCLYIAPTVPTLFAKAFLHLEATQIERDIAVWNNKRYEKAPLLVKEESAILKHRRWFNQFYSENSPKYNPLLCSARTTNLKNLYDW